MFEITWIISLFLYYKKNTGLTVLQYISHSIFSQVCFVALEQRQLKGK